MLHLRTECAGAILEGQPSCKHKRLKLIIINAKRRTGSFFIAQIERLGCKDDLCQPFVINLRDCHFILHVKNIVHKRRILRVNHNNLPVVFLLHVGTRYFDFLLVLKRVRVILHIGNHHFKQMLLAVHQLNNGSRSISAHSAALAVLL